MMIGWFFKYLPLFLFSVFTVGIVQGQTTAFTYQGKLNDGANPASGNYDIQFKLFDTATVGTGVQQGSTITNATVAVSAGVFAVQLDFGFPAFSGPPRYLELSMRPAGSPNAYTVLGPRSPVSSTPYSVRSLNASVADTLSSACVGCVTGTQIGSLPSSFSISGTGTANILSATSQFNIGGTRILSAPGTNNLFAGAGSGNANTGIENSFFGPMAGLNNAAGGGNSFFGYAAGIGNTTGSLNSYFGTINGVHNLTGNRNSFFGADAGNDNTASDNSFFGMGSGSANTTGGSNAFFGFGAGDTNTTGSNNTIIGAGADVASGFPITFGTAIGAGAVVGTPNSVVIGRPADAVYVPGIYLRVTGDISARSYAIDDGLVLSTPGLGNTLLGHSTSLSASNLTHATAIGDGALASLSNSIFLGRPGGEDAVRIAGATFIDGILAVHTLSSAGSTSLCLNSADRISSCSSSLRYKTSVQTFSRGLDIVRRLRPITFDWKEGGMHDVGFGAEEVNEIEPLLTTRNSKGEIEGVKYAQITTVLVNAVKEQQQIIEQQQKRIDALTKLVCESHPDSEVCKD